MKPDHQKISELIRDNYGVASPVQIAKLHTEGVNSALHTVITLENGQKFSIKASYRAALECLMSEIGEIFSLGVIHKAKFVKYKGHDAALIKWETGTLWGELNGRRGYWYGPPLYNKEYFSNFNKARTAFDLGILAFVIKAFGMSDRHKWNLILNDDGTPVMIDCESSFYTFYDLSEFSYIYDNTDFKEDLRDGVYSAAYALSDAQEVVDSLIKKYKINYLHEDFDKSPERDFSIDMADSVMEYFDRMSGPRAII